MSRKPRPLSLVGANYSDLFHSGLRAVSSHVRSLSAPALTDSSQSSFTASSPQSSSFWRHGSHVHSPERRFENAPSSWEDVSSATVFDSSLESVTRESQSDEEEALVIGVPSRLRQSRNLNSNKNRLSLSEFESLDPRAPSPCPTSRSFLVKLSEDNSSADNPPSYVRNDQDDSFLSLLISSETSHSYARGRPISFQTVSIPSRSPSVFTPAEKICDAHWLHGLDLGSPSEFDQDQCDVLPLSAVDVEVYHHDGADGDWRQFHADWMMDDEQLSLSAPNSPL